MKPMTFDEKRQVEFGILKDVARFCDEKGLTYFLAYGTLIGAVRHKGFIPWDDDIDIWMPRADYNEFLKIYNNEASRYRAVSPEEKIARHSFTKVIDTKTFKIEDDTDYSNGNLGVDIDIFPLDGQPEDEKMYNKWYRRLQLYYRLFSYCVMKSNGKLKKKIGLPVVKFLCGDKNNLLNKAAALHKRYSYEDSKFVGAVESCYNFINNHYKKEWFDDYILTDFENTQFKIPIGYDSILTQMYGDYMQLPPEEKRVAHHKNDAYWVCENNEEI